MAGEERRDDGQPRPKRRRRRRRRRPAEGGTPAAGQQDRSSRAAPPSGADKKNKKNKKKAEGAGSKASPTSGGKGSSSKKKGRAKKTVRGAPSAGKRASGRQRIPTTREVSAGGVVYRPTDDGDVEVVLASRRTRRGQLAWGLAKGGVEAGETVEQAAVREVQEETGYTADIEADLGDTKYMYVWDDIRIRKTVHFFLMKHTGGDPDDRDDEMEEIRWFPLERAIKRAAYRGERDMLVKASELLR
jgi:8-oxo-dGTP pyrophosphatase MutT (NUDIX family)